MASYDWNQPPESPPPRKSAGNWVLWVVGFIILMTLLNRRAPDAPETQEPGPRDASAPGPGVDRTVPLPRGAGRPIDVTQEGEWTLEEEPGHRSSTTTTSDRAAGQPDTPVKPAPPKKTAQGDWEIEEVPTDGAKTSSSVQPPAGKSTTAADRSNPGARGKKSVDGDWAIEEVESK